MSRIFDEMRRIETIMLPLLIILLIMFYYFFFVCWLDAFELCKFRMVSCDNFYGLTSFVNGFHVANGSWVHIRWQ